MASEVKYLWHSRC